jgi:mono/diheme cytochrome c family protein
MREGVPAEYRGQTNPYESSEETVAEGRQLYATHCELCHGSEGLGDGQIADSLTPSPALLAHLIQMPMAVDEYLLWSISEGGTEFGTGMPAFKEVLSREQIWKTITFLRAGLPPIAEEDGN